MNFKKVSVLIFSSIFLLLILFFYKSTAQAETYSTGETTDEVQEKLELLLSREINNFRIGNPIPVFAGSNGNFEIEDVVYFPLYADERLVGFYVIFNTREAACSNIISIPNLSEFQNLDEMESIIGIGNIDGVDCLITQKSIWQCSNYIIGDSIGSSDSFKEILLNAVDADSFNYINNTEEKTYTTQLENHLEDAKRYFFWVPNYDQKEHLNCWAAAMWSACSYLTGRAPYDPLQLAYLIAGGDVGAGNLETMVKVTDYFIYPNTSRKVTATPLEKTISEDQIRAWINREIPIVSIFNPVKNNHIDSRHAAVICGYYEKDNKVIALIIRDSASNQDLCVNRQIDGTYTFYEWSHGYQWDSTIVFNSKVSNDGGATWYLCDRDGNFFTGWSQEGNMWFYHDSTGRSVRNWLPIGGVYYYFDSNSVMHTGWLYDKEKWYYLGEDGKLQSNKWLQYNSDWYYLTSDGSAQIGWKNIEGYYYYFYENAKMATGWVQVKGSWYYFNSSGRMVTGVQSINGKYYHFNNSGAMEYGWMYIGNNWYYAYNDGAFQTGWIKIKNDWYYFNSSGIMLTGWIDDEGYRFYLDQDGKMHTGWFDSGKLNCRYYFRTNKNIPVSGGPAGSMLRNTKARIGTVVYEFDSNGHASISLPPNITPVNNNNEEEQ